MENTFIIKGPKIYTESGIIKNGSLIVKGAIVKDILKDNRQKIYSSKKIYRFPPSFHLIPGMIDIHIHGANGADMMDGEMSSLEKISKFLPREGTTSFLATTMTDTLENIDKSLTAAGNYIRQQRNSCGAEVLGIHMEGPFISFQKKGAQRGDLMLQPDLKLFKHWQKISGNIIKIVTIAPELEGAIKFTKYLKKNNVIISIGHTDADYDETVSGIKAGATHATHFFNAMGRIEQRKPGPATALLLDNSVFTELIVDNIHLHPGIVNLVFRIKGKEKIILITDAIRAKGLGEGDYDLSGQRVTVKNGQARLSDGTLAGSVLKMRNGLHNFMLDTKCSLNDAIKTVSENPAKAAGVFNRKGSIAKGKDADLVVLNDKFEVVLTLCRGVVYHKKQ